MATKKSDAEASTKPATADDSTCRGGDQVDQDVQTVHVMTNGQCNAIVVQQYLNFINGGGDIQALFACERRASPRDWQRDFSSLEAMLLTQATALQAMFMDLALRAKRQKSFEDIQTMTTLALKCAAQSRQGSHGIVGTAHAQNRDLCEAGEHCSRPTTDKQRRAGPSFGRACGRNSKPTERTIGGTVWQSPGHQSGGHVRQR